MSQDCSGRGFNSVQAGREYDSSSERSEANSTNQGSSQ